jgi:hypothetical protein
MKRVDLAFGLRGVFQWGLIRQSGSYPSFLARALVIRRGGETMGPQRSSGDVVWKYVMLLEQCPKERVIEREGCVDGDGVVGGKITLPATKCKQIEGDSPISHSLPKPF